MGDDTCSIEGCTGKRKTRGWCNKHYLRWRSNGDPLISRRPNRPTVNGQRQCPGCDEWKALAEFGRLKDRPNAARKCRPCVRKSSRALRDRDPEYHRRWFQANPGARAAYDIAWQFANPQARKALKAQSDAKRRAIETAVESEAVSPAVVYERDGWMCKLCGSPLDKGAKWPRPLSPSIDHALPLSRGGSHTYANIQAAHLRCNIIKGNREFPSSPPMHSLDPDPG